MDRKEKRDRWRVRGIFLFEVFNSEINLLFSPVHSLLFAFEEEEQYSRRNG